MTRNMFSTIISHFHHMENICLHNISIYVRGKKVLELRFHQKFAHKTLKKKYEDEKICELKTHLSLARLTAETSMQLKRLYLFPLFYKIIFF